MGSHVTHSLDVIIYSRVATRETVHNALTMEALHDLEAKAGDNLNAYVMAPNREKMWTVLGPDLGDDAGRSTIIYIVF